MTTTSTHSGLGAASDGAGIRVVQVPPDLRISAASRLIGDQGGDPLQAAQRFLESAALLRIDLDLMWCTLDEPAAGGRGGSGGGTAGMVGVRQVVLAVIGTGRTAMLFASGPDKRSRHWPGAAKLRMIANAPVADAKRERIALIEHACTQVALPGVDGRPRAVLAQALLEPRENEAAEALVGAGFQRLGDLMYMRRPLPRAGPGRAVEHAGEPEWPTGVRVSSLRELSQEGHGPERMNAWLIEALEGSYIDTQDCPELCGLRDMSDVLDSHRSVGVFDPAYWWLAIDGEDRAIGCLLLTVCPEQDSVELVYLGLAPDARGIGLGSKLLLFGIRRLYDGPMAAHEVAGSVLIGGTGGLTCAVDARNGAAVKLYRRAGFERFGVRVPFVRSLRATAP